MLILPAPSLKNAIRLTRALVDQWMASYASEPASVVLDIDDTCDVAHGHRHLDASKNLAESRVS